MYILEFFFTLNITNNEQKKRTRQTKRNHKAASTETIKDSV